MTDVDPDGVRDMRKQGDLRAFMRQQIADGQARREKPPPAKPPPPPGHRPGAWPVGTRPPNPVPPIPPAASESALNDYRRYLIETDHPVLDGTNHHCPCPGCTPRSEP